HFILRVVLALLQTCRCGPKLLSGIFVQNCLTLAQNTHTPSCPPPSPTTAALGRQRFCGVSRSRETVQKRSVNGVLRGVLCPEVHRLLLSCSDFDLSGTPKKKTKTNKDQKKNEIKHISLP
ncbi:Hypothetical protein, putative, partial [Bodo saltans]